MKIFVATSKKFYDYVKQLIKQPLDVLNVEAFYPFFNLKDEVENDEELKKNVTLSRFPEIDESDVLYVYAKDGYVGHSVTIEMAYAFAKGKEIISSEPVKEYAVRALVTKVMPAPAFLEYIKRTNK